MIISDFVRCQILHDLAFGCFGHTHEEAWILVYMIL
jgi:hypothetical protein